MLTRLFILHCVFDLVSGATSLHSMVYYIFSKICSFVIVDRLLLFSSAGLTGSVEGELDDSGKGKKGTNWYQIKKCYPLHRKIYNTKEKRVLFSLQKSFGTTIKRVLWYHLDANVHSPSHVWSWEFTIHNLSVGAACKVGTLYVEINMSFARY